MGVEWCEPAVEWFDGLSDGGRKKVAKIVRLLEAKGRGLNATAYSAKLHEADELYELRITYQGNPFRLLYAFESNGAERAVILVAGDKTGDDRFYQTMIPDARDVLESYRRDS